MIEVVKLEKEGPFQEPLARAASIIEAGGIVAFPTESFYGLGAGASNESALKRLFLVKKRDPAMPILIFISSINELSKYTASVPPKALELAGKFWPGALTILFEASPDLSTLLTAGTRKIGIRISGHPVARALTSLLNMAITGTSANISGSPPCTRADQIVKYFGDTIDLILDGGTTEGKLPSSILDVTHTPPRLIREGIIKAKEIIDSEIYEELLVPEQEGDL
ncbi:MAG: L-threonylcarbamoyladenylate synthase [Thermodesulfobacteriota bacterium]